MNQTVLTHHGIPGQKWGIRRFQRPDGSLTPKGQARLDKKDNKWASTKGEKIKTLKKDNLQKGSHRLIWDGKDEEGHRVPSGIYLYKMRTSDFVVTKKAILLK